ncbi:MAG: glycosyltransferase family A protein [Patescibacteria group bacterium]|nr:glycosyltransferase family A protein [Patescibacteria group bacterium]
MVPVALFAYNRPQNLPRTLACLKNNRIDLLYIFSDGPKNEADEKKVREVREILDQIDWVKTEKIYQEKNIGLSESVISGVNKVLERYDRIICVEDDICVADGFYEYMKACLEKYRDNPEITGVTGMRYPLPSSTVKNYPYDVFFFPRFLSWGWGTWRRSWQSMDFDRESIANKIRSAKLDTRPAGNDVKKMVERLINGALYGCWDVFCSVNMLLNKQFFVWPSYNMVENSGLYEGTHASGKPRTWELKWDKEKFPQLGRLRFPETEKEQEEMRKKTRAFLNKYAVKPRWKRIIIFTKSLGKRYILKIFNAFGLKIKRKKNQPPL